MKYEEAVSKIEKETGCGVTEHLQPDGSIVILPHADFECFKPYRRDDVIAYVLTPKK